MSTNPLDIFRLVKERCLLSNLNVRTEMHGDEREPACDLNFEFTSANNLLAKLHPELRDSFYMANATRDMLDADSKPHLRYPMLGPVTWDLEIPRTLLRIHDSEDDAHDVILGGGKTNKFKLTMKEGGTIHWHFRCQFSKPDEDSIAKLMRVLNQTVPISLECADEEKKLDNFEKAEHITKEPMSAAREEAESLFSAPPTEMTGDELPDFGNDPSGDPNFDVEFSDEEAAPEPAKKKERKKRTASTAEVE